MSFFPEKDKWVFTSLDKILKVGSQRINASGTSLGNRQ